MTRPGPPAVDCHVRLGVDLVRHQWDAVVLTVLRDRPARRVELRSALGGVGDKVLHDALGRLRAHGLVERSPDTTYRLTPIGLSFARGPLLSLAQWAEEHHGCLVPETGRAEERGAPSDR